jgi:hypothetical protein
MREVERALAAVTPRRATMALLRFDEMIEECERRTGRRMTNADRRFLASVFRSALAKECRTSNSD